MPVLAGVTLVVPWEACGPLHAPLAVHELTPVDDQLSTALCPTVMVAGATPIVMLGVGAGGGGCATGKNPGVLNEQAKKEEACAQIATTPTHQASNLERELHLLDTCTARASPVATNRSGTLSVRASNGRCALNPSDQACSVYAPRGALAREGTLSLIVNVRVDNQ